MITTKSAIDSSIKTMEERAKLLRKLMRGDGITLDVRGKYAQQVVDCNTAIAALKKEREKMLEDMEFTVSVVDGIMYIIEGNDDDMKEYECTNNADILKAISSYLKER